jgi:hypothetical protein
MNFTFPEREPTPERLPTPEPEVVYEPISMKHIEEEPEEIKLIPQRRIVDEGRLNEKQRSVHKFMTLHPFKDSPQAPAGDVDMLTNLGSIRSKTMESENIWRVEYQNGTKYTGTIDLDSSSKNFEQPILAGNFQFPNGDQYEGTVGVRAKGIYMHSNGVKYEGQFFRLAKSGNGTQTFPNGDVYCGMFKHNLYHGKGQLKFANGDSFKGNFINGKREHIGTYVYVSGENVVGDWEADELHGTGEYRFTNGQKIKNTFEGSRIKL